jgi:hypothetical protein
MEASIGRRTLEKEQLKSFASLQRKQFNQPNPHNYKHTSGVLLKVAK